VRRIGVLVSGAEDDPEMQARLAGFPQGLARFGWSEGRNLSAVYRFAMANAERAQAAARYGSGPVGKRIYRGGRSLSAGEVLVALVSGSAFGTCFASLSGGLRPPPLIIQGNKEKAPRLGRG
jgi:hypothetical protein